MDVNGVGYQVNIPLSSYDRLPAQGSKVRILTHLAVREDAHVLYGFATVEERDLFRLLVQSVSGVGPKLALAVLSGMSVEAFKGAVVAADIAGISRINGVGKKTAERMVVELKDKVGIASEWEVASNRNAADSAESRQFHDAVLALIALGYKQVDAHKALRAASAQAGKETPGTEDLVRVALKSLAR